MVMVLTATHGSCICHARLSSAMPPDHWGGADVLIAVQEVEDALCPGDTSYLRWSQTLHGRIRERGGWAASLADVSDSAGAGHGSVAVMHSCVVVVPGSA